MITQNCPICHKNFLTKSRNRQICCSSSCGSKLQWNKRKKGKQISCQNCNKILYVSPYRIKDAKFCSRSCTALYNFPKVKKYFIRKGFFREKNPNWKGGKYTSERHKAMKQLEYIEWRKKIFERDDYTCRNCGERGGKINADHIKKWSLHPELRLDLNNGQTLCKDCHLEKTQKEAKIYWANQYASGVYKLGQVVGTIKNA